MLGLAGLSVASDDVAYTNPLAPKPPHFPVKAKRIIPLFMNGGPSHIDTFAPKPQLEKYAGQELPTGNLKTERKTGAAFPSPFKFKNYGESGLPVSEIFRHTAKHADDLCVVRSMHADVPNHEPSLLLMNCGESRQVRPSLGSCMTYGLGTENQNLPGFIAMCPGGYPITETQNWQSAFLPGIYQGTYIDTKHAEIEKLIENIRNPSENLPQQRQQLNALQTLNRIHLQQREQDPALEARIQSFELAYRMQQEASEAFDVSREPQHILDAYGKGTQARQVLIARRLGERGVRFVQLWHGAGQPWDNHDDIEVNHRRLAGEVDQAIGALLTDLKQSGLLDETLVIWGGEFGRMPMSDPGKGRDHNPWGYSMWLAGGGLRKGIAYGATDDVGLRATEKRVSVRNFHATLLHLLGIDHNELTFFHNGLAQRLTGPDEAEVVEEILA